MEQIGGAGPLVRTKLFVPPSRPGWLARARLLDALTGAEHVPLTLVSAGAGFGKTSLVTEWLHERSGPQAWYSLDASDGDPGRFWTYVVAALSDAAPDAFGPLGEAMRSPSPPDLDGLVTTLINAAAGSSEQVVLVLDDLHTVESPPVHEQLATLLQHCPPQLRLIVTTRVDPPWPLARMRARGEVCELRASDLRFTPDEASALLLSTLGDRVAPAQCEALRERTEGWVTGLHMAVLSLRNNADVSKFVDDFSGSHRFVLDYLAEEVLHNQDEVTRDFLVRTSVFDRFCPSLCDEVLKIDAAAELINQLDARNLFVVPLDDTRTWYRYHHLFREYLRSCSRADEAKGLHRRASRWFEEQGLTEECIDHALDGEDFERAAELLEKACEARFTVQHQVRTDGWLARLPAAHLNARPALCSTQIWASFVIGKWDKAQRMLDAARAALDAPDSPIQGRVKTEADAQYRMFTAFLHFEYGRHRECIDIATALLDEIGDTPSRVASLARLAMGGSLLHTGDLDRLRAVCQTVLGRSDDPINQQVALSLLAQAEMLDGRLMEVRAIYERAMEGIGEGRGPIHLAAGITRVRMGEVLREQNRLSEAEELLREAIAQCERQLGLNEHVYTGSICLARTLVGAERVEEAREILQEAEDLRQQHLGGRPRFDGLLGPALLDRGRLWLELGRFDEVLRWLDANPLDGLVGAEAALRVLRAQCLVARGEEAVAREILAAVDTEPAFVRTRIEAALLGERLGIDRGDARALAKEHGYQRILSESPIDGQTTAAAPEPPTSASELAEPLNDRERGILRLMEAGMSNADIARELYLSVHTVKWHARKLYEKLGVGSRTQAVAAARNLKLL